MLTIKKMSACEKAFNALGDPTRRLIFEKLRDRAMPVVDIANGLPVSRPAVSQHLKVLREAKLITMYQKGTRSICQVDREGVLAMRDYLDKFWNDALAAFKTIAEQTEKEHE
jgi:DNA-binding transcriptional ArsR family regulator